jgi:3-methyl-2-oxobutanoate hydroxymethyltransferase
MIEVLLMERKEKVTVPKIIAMKEGHSKIAALTAYDALFAGIVDNAGVDIILVGDSAGMVCAGYDNTLPTTMDEMLYHTKSVTGIKPRALVIADMPFLSYQIGKEEAIRNAGRFMKEGLAEGVKVEGGETVCEQIRTLVAAGIPVMGHLGLTPQSIHSFGGWTVRGKTKEDREKMMAEAQALEDAGCFSIVLEKIPYQLAEEITRRLAIPTIGIGAGPYTDGQVLVLHDILGLFTAFRPKFVKRYAELGKQAERACSTYVDEVRKGTFPTMAHSFSK